MSFHASSHSEGGFQFLNESLPALLELRWGLSTQRLSFPLALGQRAPAQSRPGTRHKTVRPLPAVPHLIPLAAWISDVGAGLSLVPLVRCLRAAFARPGQEPGHR
jgi:hypothetical protein